FRSPQHSFLALPLTAAQTLSNTNHPPTYVWKLTPPFNQARYSLGINLVTISPVYIPSSIFQLNLYLSLVYNLFGSDRFYQFQNMSSLVPKLESLAINVGSQLT